jgi:hypothetical protein
MEGLYHNAAFTATVLRRVAAFTFITSNYPQDCHFLKKNLPRTTRTITNIRENRIQVRVVGAVGGETLEFPGSFPALESKRRCPGFCTGRRHLLL